MPPAGIEPALCCQNGILSPARLPVPPWRHSIWFIIRPPVTISKNFFSSQLSGILSTEQRLHFFSSHLSDILSTEQHLHFFSSQLFGILSAEQHLHKLLVKLAAFLLPTGYRLLRRFFVRNRQIQRNDRMSTLLHHEMRGIIAER